MKIDTKRRQFAPISITIETRAEAAALAYAIGKVSYIDYVEGVETDFSVESSLEEMSAAIDPLYKALEKALEQ